MAIAVVVVAAVMSVPGRRREAVHATVVTTVPATVVAIVMAIGTATVVAAGIATVVAVMAAVDASTAMVATATIAAVRPAATVAAIDLAAAVIAAVAAVDGTAAAVIAAVTAVDVAAAVAAAAMAAVNAAATTAATTTATAHGIRHLGSPCLVEIGSGSAAFPRRKWTIVERASPVAAYTLGRILMGSTLVSTAIRAARADAGVGTRRRPGSCSPAARRKPPDGRGRAVAFSQGGRLRLPAWSQCRTPRRPRDR
jgi:hypothetical protein